MELTRVALYMRVSTEIQAKEGDSIPAQRDALRKYALEKGYIVVDEYVDEGISGRKFRERDELQRLLQDIQERKINQILFTKLDRWYRSIRHYTATQELLDKYNVTWLAIWEPIYDTTTPSGRLIVNQMMSIAQFEAENTGQRIKQVFEYKISQGEVVTGSCPPGYSIKDKHLVPNEDADMVRDMFDYYRRTNNLRQTVFYMEREYGFVRSQGHIRNYLNNTLYIGVYRGNKAYCEPIIDKDTFEEVKRLLGANIKASRKHSYIFTGLVYCAECGRTLKANHQTCISRSKDGTRKKVSYAVYSCQQGTIYHRCTNRRTINEKVLEKALMRSIIPELQKYVAEYDVTERKKVDNTTKIKQIEERMQRTKDLYVVGIISLDEVISETEKYQKQIFELQKEPEEKDLTALKEFLSMDFEEMYKSLEIPEKRRIWYSIIREIRFNKDRSITFDFL